MTQAEVAKRLNVDQAAVSAWECGRASPQRKYRKPLEELFGVSYEELFAGGEEHAEGGGKADAGLHVGGENSGRD